MARRRYLVAYDISDDRRLRAVHSILVAHGHPLQYSVFICDLDDMEKTGLRWQLGDTISHAVDRVVFIDLGSPNDIARFEFMGVRPTLPVRGPTIV